MPRETFAERFERENAERHHEEMVGVASGLLLIALAQRLGISEEPDIALMIKVIDGGSPADDEAFALRCAEAMTQGKIPGAPP